MRDDIFRFEKSFNFFPAPGRHIAPWAIINPYIQTSTAYTSVSVMHMAKEMECTSVALIPFVNRVVEHADTLSPDLDFFVVLARSEVLAKLRRSDCFVVVSVNQVDITLQATQRLLGLLDAPERYVAQVVNPVPWANTLIPVIDQ